MLESISSCVVHDQTLDGVSIAMKHTTVCNTSSVRDTKWKREARREIDVVKQSDIIINGSCRRTEHFDEIVCRVNIQTPSASDEETPHDCCQHSDCVDMRDDFEMCSHSQKRGGSQSSKKRQTHDRGWNYGNTPSFRKNPCDAPSHTHTFLSMHPHPFLGQHKNTNTVTMIIEVSNVHATLKSFHGALKPLHGSQQRTTTAKETPALTCGVLHTKSSFKHSKQTGASGIDESVDHVHFECRFVKPTWAVLCTSHPMQFKCTDTTS